MGKCSEVNVTLLMFSVDSHDTPRDALLRLSQQTMTSRIKARASGAAASLQRDNEGWYGPGHLSDLYRIAVLVKTYNILIITDQHLSTGIG